MIVVSDTTPIISMLKIDKLYLLGALFGEIVIPEAVYGELTTSRKFVEEAKQIKECSFIKVVKVENNDEIELLRRATGLDIGESEAIIYSDKNHADILIMDEAKGRMVAKQMGLCIMGTIGILIEAYDGKLLTKDEILHCIDILKSTGRHISDQLFDKIRSRINEEASI
jgi:predicted nucleic acid-binding protein